MRKIPFYISVLVLFVLIISCSTLKQKKYNSDLGPNQDYMVKNISYSILKMNEDYAELKITISGKRNYEISDYEDSTRTCPCINIIDDETLIWTHYISVFLPEQVMPNEKVSNTNYSKWLPFEFSYYCKLQIGKESKYYIYCGIEEIEIKELRKE